MSASARKLRAARGAIVVLTAIALAGCVDGTTPDCRDASVCGPPVTPPSDASAVSDASDAKTDAPSDASVVANAPDTSTIADANVADATSDDAADATAD